jgi:uncharacterized protein YkwD
MRRRPAILSAILALLLVLAAQPAASTEICGDHDGNGSVATSDALRLLKNAVGQDVPLECPDMCVAPECGNGSCGAGESCATCSSDCGSCSGCAGASDETTALDAQEVIFLDALNAYRDDAGRQPVLGCTSLARAAQGHSEDMRDNDFFSTTGSDGTTSFERACNACYELGCGPEVAMAEVIAAGNSGGAATLEQLEEDQGTLLRQANFVRVGLGRATGGGEFGSYWTILLSVATEASCN